MNKRLPQEIIQTPVAGMQKITARFRVTTPMFMGGADNKTTAELRAPSLKSVLRFWWRALAWSRCDENLERIRKEEAALFGSDETGQGKFLMRLANVQGVLDPSKDNSLFKGKGGARYLGYGVIDLKWNLERPYIASPLTFDLELLFKREIEPSIIDGLKLMGLLGGAGSKSRKGYGSLTLLELIESGNPCWRAPQNGDEFSREIGNLLETAVICDREPTYSAFSAQSRVDILEESPDPMRLLDLMGGQMQVYRGWVWDSQTRKPRTENNFSADRRWCHHPQPKDEFHPRRLAFGLPHNYTKQGVSCEPFGTNVGNRRASPLVLHIHEYRPGSYAAIATVLRSAFLPEEARILVKLANTRQEYSIPQQADYSVIDGFLDGHKGPSDRKTKNKYFPNARKVFPS